MRLEPLENEKGKRKLESWGLVRVNAADSVDYEIELGIEGEEFVESGLDLGALELGEELVVELG